MRDPEYFVVMNLVIISVQIRQTLKTGVMMLKIQLWSQE